MKINLPEKLYYNIGEISNAFNLNASLLRFWEKEFEILNPKKQSRAQENTIQLILKISN